MPLFALLITKNGHKQLTEPNIINNLQSDKASMQALIMAQHLSEVVIVIDESAIVTYWTT